ncbi:MAG: hypothetical protein U5N53_00630 [Mycobacterium sp.]|nr:hypothetical protein [Mycobacterium sp.]
MGLFYRAALFAQATSLVLDRLDVVDKRGTISSQKRVTADNRREPPVIEMTGAGEGEPNPFPVTMLGARNQFFDPVICGFKFCA